MKTVRLIQFLLLFSSYTISSLLCFRYKKFRRIKKQAIITSRYSKKLLKILGMKVAIKGFIDGDVFKPKAMIVSNHISYIDILVISSLIPTVFVTSFDVKQQFFLGFLSRLGSSIFVDRRPMRFNPHQIIEIAKVMVHSCSVSIFPEATSSDGTKLLPFKSSLFEAALKISGIIQPAVIRYSDKSVAYYGNHNFFSHFWNLLGIRNTDIVIEFLPVLKATEDMKRHELCKSTYKLILSKMEAYNATI